LIRSGIARLEEVHDANGGLENLYVRVSKSVLFCFVKILGSLLCLSPQVDREQVLSQGKTVTGKLLVELQVRKSTADGAGARQFYTNLTKPIPGWEGEIRDLVLKKKLVSPFPSPLRFISCSFERAVSECLTDA
jgi:dipeptidyl-peptidase-3